jgi:hypothetical protein
VPRSDVAASALAQRLQSHGVYQVVGLLAECPIRVGPKPRLGGRSGLRIAGMTAVSRWHVNEGDRDAMLIPPDRERRKA